MTTPTRKETISSRILADLRAAILQAELAPGAKINLDHLRSRFDTSISPLREALARLTADGLVLFEDQRGFRVAPVSVAELDDIYAMRIELETTALRESLRCGEMDWESGIIRALHLLGRSSPTETPERWRDVHDGFHRALIAGSGRALLLRTCAGLADLSRRYSALTGLLGYGDDGPASHEAIALAATRRTADAAVLHLSRHLRDEKAAIAQRLGSAPGARLQPGWQGRGC